MWVVLASLLVAQTPVQEPNDAVLARRRTPVVEVVESAGPAVVNIATEIGGNPFARRRNEDEAPFFFGGRGQPRNQSLGSGVIIDATGLVLTNEHVVSQASNITITLSDRRTFEADVVGADPSFDIAVLKVRNAPKNLPSARLGTSEDLMPGETVVAIGNPFGLANTVTTGVVSALHRSIEARDRVYEDFIQTDAAINPGNSGGALLNILGELIGINTAIYGSGQGIGFAIPITKAKAVIDEVLRYGEVRPVYSGLLVGGARDAGALVTGVRKGSPAEAAGLVPGDLIVDVGGQEVRTPRAYRHMERSLVPGGKAKITLLRGNERRSLTMTVSELSPEKAADLGRIRLGLTAQVARGQLVITSVEPRSEAARVGIRKGDLLLAIGGRRPTNQAELDRLLAWIHDAEAVTVVIGRGGRAYYVTLELKE
ncbi:MAG: trypsin-like peptidase domain-containing protein [Deltaproteobacteria bacterium]|jgi:serine protease Do|nr:trypsin-like peptidase domain-containing protein [Deltaproteobacteria bacterium]